MIGVGIATAIAIDATLVRLVLVPATMALLGKANWYLPRWLDRVLPDLDPHGMDESRSRWPCTRRGSRRWWGDHPERHGQFALRTVRTDTVAPWQAFGASAAMCTASGSTTVRVSQAGMTVRLIRGGRPDGGAVAAGGRLISIDSWLAATTTTAVVGAVPDRVGQVAAGAGEERGGDVPVPTSRPVTLLGRTSATADVVTVPRVTHEDRTWPR